MSTEESRTHDPLDAESSDRSEDRGPRWGLREVSVYALLLAVKAISRVFYRFETTWVGDVPERPFDRLRLVAGLNHTSLYEPLWAGALPNQFLRQIALEGVVPAADKTLKRPFVGRFFRFIAKHVVPVSRERDHTWQEVMDRIGPRSMVVLFPEGRMKRADGLDSHGKPMTVRGGIADLLKAIPSGRMLLGYSGGLHHVQAPGQIFPRLFKTLKLALEVVEIPRYREMLEAAGGTGHAFKKAVIQDLQERRDRYCGTG